MENLLKQMTLREKLAQLTQLDAGFFTQYGTSELTGPLHAMKISEQDVAACGSVLGAVGAEKIIEIQKKHLEVDRNKIPLLFMLDIIHGFRTIFPINLALGCTWEPELFEDIMRISAKEAAASGISVNFAPMADLVRDARWGRVMEATGEDPYLNSLFSAAAVKGLQGDDLKNPEALAACVKHFAGYGAVIAGRDYNTTEIGDNTLFEFYMPSYKAALDAGVSAVMSAFNALNGVPCTCNEWLLRDILRRKYSFNGVLISDWGAVGELVAHGVAENGKEAAEKSLRSGIDIEMMTSNYLQFGEELVKEGVISEAVIDEAVLRILKLKKKMGLFEDPYRNASAKLEEELLNCEEHRKASYNAAVKSMVLLENNGILPLKENLNVAIIGPYSDNNSLIGGWGCTGRFEEVISIKQAAENGNYNARFSFAEGCGITERNGEELKKAIEISSAADVVILALGEHADMSGEAASKTDISLPECQIELLNEISKCNKNIVTVLFNGRPLLLKDIAVRSSALLEGWFPGYEGGKAVCDILFGRALPEGRLTMSFPYCNGQMPVYYNAFSTGRPVLEGNSGERYLSKYIDAPNKPLYPFGYGLGYSKTEYGGITAEEKGENVIVKVAVKNIGDFSVTETVQLYVRDCFASVVRPVKQLKAFKKVTLSPDECREVMFTLTRNTFSFYDKNGDLKFEKGKFQIMVGSSSENYISENIELGLIL